MLLSSQPVLLRSELSIEVQVEVLEAQNSVHFEFEEDEMPGEADHCPLPSVHAFEMLRTIGVRNVILVEDPSPRDVPVDDVLSECVIMI